MTAHRVAELDGALLDAAVAKAEGATPAVGLRSPHPHWQFPGDLCVQVAAYLPSTDWAQAGPIIERERIDILQFDNGAVAFCGAHHELSNGGCQYDFEVTPRDLSPTPLIAAMRAYVASKFGDTVEIT